MTTIIDDVSRTFNEYLLLPGYSGPEHLAHNVSLAAPLAAFREGESPRLQLGVPLVSAAMQSVTGPELAIALARKGGAGFIYCSQTIEAQVEMIRKVKEHKAGFVQSDSNLAPTDTLRDALALREKTGHSTMPVTEGGEKNGKLLGILTSKDYWEFKDDLDRSVTEYATGLADLVKAEEGISLQEATEILWENKKECLPIVRKDGTLAALVFRKDYFDHKSNPRELTDDKKRLVVGAALNTFDYMERAEALLAAGCDVLCLDSSDGYTEWQKKAALELRAQFPDIVLGGGNVVSADAFRFLAEEAKLDFVKVGIGGGSICITREQKGIGRGQASAVIEIAAERTALAKETGRYVPICSDGGLGNDTNIIMALALGADFVMMGKYFAQTQESPTEKISYGGRLYKPYWGEGSARAKNWQRYKQDEKGSLVFEEGVDAYVPYSGPLSDRVDITVAKLSSTMCNCGSLSLIELHEKARVTRVSEMTLVEGGTSSVERLDRIVSHRD